jgi:hypothetical protein
MKFKLTLLVARTKIRSKARKTKLRSNRQYPILTFKSMRRITEKTMRMIKMMEIRLTRVTTMRNKKVKVSLQTQLMSRIKQETLNVRRLLRLNRKLPRDRLNF